MSFLILHILIYPLDQACNQITHVGLLMRDAIVLYGDTVSATDLPVIIVEDDEAFITTAKGHLIAAIVPPVGERLTIHHITEDNHVPENTSNVCHCTCNSSKATCSRKQKTLLLLLAPPCSVPYLIWRQRCSQTQSLPQVVSSLMVTGFMEPSSLLGGPTQSLTSCH